MPAAAPGSCKHTHQQTLHLNGKKKSLFPLVTHGCVLFLVFLGGFEGGVKQNSSQHISPGRCHVTYNKRRLQPPASPAACPPPQCNNWEFLEAKAKQIGVG